MALPAIMTLPLGRFLLRRLAGPDQDYDCATRISIYCPFDDVHVDSARAVDCAKALRADDRPNTVIVNYANGCLRDDCVNAG